MKKISLFLGLSALCWLPFNAMAVTGVGATTFAKVLLAQQTQSAIGDALIQSIQVESHEGTRLSSTNKFSFRVAEHQARPRLFLRQIVWEQTATIEGWDNLLLRGNDQDLGSLNVKDGELVSGVPAIDLATILNMDEVKAKVKNDWIRSISIVSRQYLGDTDPLIHKIRLHTADSITGKNTGCVDITWRLDMTKEGVDEQIHPHRVRCQSVLSVESRDAGRG